MSNVLNGLMKRALVVSSAMFGWRLYQHSVDANPAGGSVTQGSATINTSGSVETITTSGNAYINWQSFNIGAGETTTFVEPTSSSVVWNNINSSSASQILGNLNANGYVILQNEAGFYVGGQAAITAHGLVMTTSAMPAPNLSSGGAWEFDALPPVAPVINYGRINITGGGSAFLIADQIDNEGTISAPSGKIGLYAGEQVLVSTSPDGRGLSAAVTLPAGSVDNNGQLIADGGSIMALAQTVNQNGLVQANSVKEVNGTIELVGSDAVNLGSSSAISAQGDSTGASSGGSVTIQSGSTFSDQAGSTINISGGPQGGNGGQVEISAPQMGAIQSTISGEAAAGFSGGVLTIDPTDIWLASADADSAAPGNYTVVNINSFSGLSQINLQADDDIVLNTLWTLPASTSAASLSLSAGNDITINDQSGISAGKNWSVSLSAGTAFAPTVAQPTPVSGNDGVYLNGSGFIQAQNGDLNVTAANEVIVQNGEITTLGGGNVSVMATFGNVNAGQNDNGYIYSGNAPYYSVTSALGGISTADGGSVTITAGGNVYSFLPGGTDITDSGSGAFGSAPGNVTVIAGGSVYGHYVLANGTGAITARNGNIGDTSGFALSLIDGTWSINAPNGDIYLQEVRNPNGDFNNLTGGTRGHLNTAGEHLFNYGADATVNLDADGVFLTDANIPRGDVNGSSTPLPIPVLYPPILNITAGADGVTIEGDVTLFPSLDQYLSINIFDGGNLVGIPSGGSDPELLMSDSPGDQFSESQGSVNTFDNSDLGMPGAVEPTGSIPVKINVLSGNMENLTLVTSMATTINVGGNLVDCTFSGQNLKASDLTTIKVGGEISQPSVYADVTGITIPGVPASDLFPGLGLSWDDIFILALNPSVMATLTLPPNTPPADSLSYILGRASLFGANETDGKWSAIFGGDQGFIYNAATGQLAYSGAMSASLASFLSGPITILKLVNGEPVQNANGTFQTVTVNWAPVSAVQTLYSESQSDVDSATAQDYYYEVGGPGTFDVTAGSISLGASYGIFSAGVEDARGTLGDRYNNLASITPEGASLDVQVTGNLDMLTSTIATLGGGDLSINSMDGSLDLGIEGIVNEGRQVGYGVFTSGPGDVSVTAFGDIDIDGSRIATYDGGNIFVESYTGNVNVGSGGDTFSGALNTYVNSAGLAGEFVEDVYGSGILAVTLQTADASSVNILPPNYPSVPGNITVETPQGNITSDLGGITQEALDGNVSGGPTITLSAGTFASGTPGDPDYVAPHTGNVDLGQSGVIGGTVNITANGNITGLVISRQDSNINAAQNFSGSVISGGEATVGAGGSVSGVIVGVGGASVSGGSISANVISQNANVNGSSSDSLGASATATSTSQAAAQQANTQSQQQVADNTSDDSDDDKKKKKPGLLQHIKRVTVILPKSV